jgi:hypothetical protein
VLKINFLNANPSPEILGEDKLSSYSNYFLGRDSTKWRSWVGHYRKVVAKEVWPGIDVEYRVQPEGVETVFRVKPGADVSQIKVEYEGLDAPLAVDSRGDLILQTSLGKVHEKAPYAYQSERRRQVDVPVQYRLLNDSSYSFSVSEFKTNRELVVDPLLYSSFFGGDQTDIFYDSDLDSDGNIVIVGKTSSSNLPVTPGAYQEIRHSWGDVMVAKFDATGQSLLTCTYIGGNGSDKVRCCQVIDNGTICLAGVIASSPGDTWPLTANALDTIFGGSYEAFLSCLSGDGTELLFSSYLGGSGFDLLFDMDRDDENNIYITGESRVSGFPTTPDALYADTVGAVVLKFDPMEFDLLYSTMIPGSTRAFGRRISVVAENDVWISGRSFGGGVPLTADAYMDTLHDGDAYFFMHLNLNQPQILYSSNFPVIGSLSIQAIDDGSILLYGSTNSPFIPVTDNAFDPVPPDLYVKPFFCKFRLPDSIEYATYFGSQSHGSALEDLVIDDDGSLIVAGSTRSHFFPTTPDAFDLTFNSIDSTFSDIFLSRLSADLSRLEYSTYIGGIGEELVHGVSQTTDGSVWLVGATQATGFPITQDAFQPVMDPDNLSGDAFFLRFDVPRTESIVTHPNTLPVDFELMVYPNPFNPSTTISFSLPRPSSAMLKVFNLLGQSVFEADLGRLKAGKHDHFFKADGLPSGMYVIEFSAGDLNTSTRLIVIR